jgi:hypothetical protein
MRDFFKGIDQWEMRWVDSGIIRYVSRQTILALIFIQMHASPIPKRPLGKCLVICLADFYRCITNHCNDVELTTAMLPISVRYLCRNIKRWANFSRYLKRFILDSRFLPSSQISEKMYNSVVSNKFMMWKLCRSPTLCSYLQTIIECKWQKQGFAE